MSDIQNEGNGLNIPNKFEELVFEYLWDVDLVDKYLEKWGVNTKYINIRTLSVATYAGYNVGKIIYDRLKDVNRKSITVEDSSDLYKPVFIFLVEELNFFENVEKVNVESLKTTDDNRIQDSNETSFNLNEEVQRIQIPKEFDKTITYNGAKIHIERIYEEKELYNNIYKKEHLNFKFNIKDNKSVIRFLYDAVQYYYQEYIVKRDSISVYQSSSHGWWNEVHSDLNRPLKSVFLEGDKKQEIVQDIEDFTENKQFFQEKGIPYKRNYLFYGKSGSGKTSLIKALGTYFNRNIYFLVITDQIHNDDFLELINNIPKNTILVLEDIDVLFEKRNGNDNNKITFDTFINALDGIISNNDLITFMTTNHVEKLDEALLRSGRIDYKLEFDDITVDMGRKMLSYLTGVDGLTPKEDRILKEYVSKGKKASDLQTVIINSKTRDKIFENL